MELKKAASRTARSAGQLTLTGLVLAVLEQRFTFTKEELALIAFVLNSVFVFAHNWLEANEHMPHLLEQPAPGDEATEPVAGTG